MCLVTFELSKTELVAIVRERGGPGYTYNYNKQCFLGSFSCVNSDFFGTCKALIIQKELSFQYSTLGDKFGCIK